MSDGTTTTTHEPMVVERFTLVPGVGRTDERVETVCTTCYLPNDRGCLPETERAPWPCDAAKAEAENARLRERVALLEGALRAVSVPLINGVVCWCEGSRDMRHGHGDACRQARAALAQAGEGGAA